MKLLILLAVGIAVAYCHSRGDDHTKAPSHTASKTWNSASPPPSPISVIKAIQKLLNFFIGRSDEEKKKEPKISELTASLLSIAVKSIDPEVYKLAKPILEGTGSFAEKKEDLNDIIDSLPSYKQDAAFDGFSKYLEMERSIYKYFLKHAQSLSNENVKTAIELFSRAYTNEDYTRAESYSKAHKYQQHFTENDWEVLQEFVREKLIELQRRAIKLQYMEAVNPPRRFEISEDKHVRLRWTKQSFHVALEYLKPFLAGVSPGILNRFGLEFHLQERKTEVEQKKKLQLLIARMAPTQRPALTRGLEEWTHINYLLNDFVVRKIAALPESVVKTAAEDIALAQLSPHISGKELSAKLGEIEKSLSTEDLTKVRLILQQYVEEFGQKLAKWLKANYEIGPSKSTEAKGVTANDFHVE